MEKKKLALEFLMYMITACLQLCFLVYCIVLPADGNKEALISLYEIAPVVFFFHLMSMAILFIEMTFYLLLSFKGKETNTIRIAVGMIQLLSAALTIAGPFVAEQDNF